MKIENLLRHSCGCCGDKDVRFVREGFDTVETSGIDGAVGMVEGGEELDVVGTAVVEAQVCRTGLVSGQGC